MARKASVEKNNRRKTIATKYIKYRAELRASAIDQKLSEEERSAARRKLQDLPRETTMTRVRNRCVLTGRPRGNYRKFGLCRNAFRKMALEGRLPGVTKASW
ncbi:MAG: 30S ribosomal protein S14 [Bdellovibrionaceae bacterium]|nr:30S ribosomal protein S14 [Pseudobdellovibrionaceae bacterium]